jgi:hypothetical protein
MSDPSYFRDRAEQCLRLARDSTDPTLVQSLTELAAEYATRAIAMEAVSMSEDSDDRRVSRTTRAREA